ISKKIYKTGDLARWLSDGNIEFIGRIDHQVKVRGFRVELGEIENCLIEMEVVKDTVVVHRKDKTGEAYLCAYVVPFRGGEKEVDILQLNEYLSARLPYFMIPGYFMVLETIPLSPNGKVDRKALPGPWASARSGTYEPPADEVEAQIAGIWQEVLGIERISINDNFFEIGGDSIKALQVSARLLHKGLKLEISDLYANPTIKQARNKTKTRGTHPPSPQGTISGEVMLTPIQEWFFKTSLTHKHHFNQAVMLYRSDGFDEKVIKKVFTRLVGHHDALRMVYQVKESSVLQRNRGWEEPLFHLGVKNLKACEAQDIAGEIEKQANRIQRAIDLNKGPLMHLGLFKTNQGDHLLIVIHHLVVDGVSWRILLEDFALGYSQAQRGEAIGLPKKTDSFKYWARKLNDYSKSKELKKELAYWKWVEKTKTSIPPLPKDHQATKKEKRNKNVEIITVSMDQAETRKLLKEVNKAYNTEINDILLTALGLAFKKWAGLEKIAINLEGHGREPIIPGTHIGRTVGWFTAQYPLVLDLSHSEELSYNIKFVKETLRKIPNKGIGYGILRYITPAEQKQGLTFGPEPEINFNYLGQFSQEIGGNGSGSTIEISRFDTGQSLDPEAESLHFIDIGGMLVEGNLHMRFSYNKYEFKRKTIQTLADFFKLHLEAITTHCSQKEKSEFTPSDLGYNKISLEELQKIEDLIDEEIRQIYPLAPMQAGILFHAMKNKTSRAYFEQIILTIKGNLDITLFEKSFKKLVERYDILRTAFVYELLEEPLQVILRKRDARIHYEDISLVEENKKKHFLETFKKKDREKGFDLTGDLLMRISIFKTAEKSFRLVWDFHHILMDGWCSGIIYNDLIRIYQLYQKGELLQMTPVPPYENYIQWLEKQDKDEGLRYWRKYLDGYEQPAIIPKSGKSLKPLGNNPYQVKEYCLVLDETLSRGLREIARKHQVTINLLFLAVWGVLLQRYNNTHDVVFGSVVSGRPPEVEGIEDMIGLFINTIPVRITVQTNNKTFYQLVQTLYKQALLSKPYEYIPLADIQANSWLKGLLIDHIMVFENYPLQEAVKHTEFRESLEFSIEVAECFEQTNYDFNVIVRPGETIHVIFNFNSLVYTVDFIENTALHVREIFRQVAENPGLDIDIGEIEIVTAEEKYRLLDEFNDTEVDFPGDKTIHRLFEEQAETIPDNTAVIGEMQSAERKAQSIRRNKERHALCAMRCALTYRELNRQSHQLAHLLREKGAGPDTVVGLMVERSLEMIVGILAILKSGSAYLPMDPRYPEERVKYILKDSDAKTLVIDTGLPGKLKELSIVNCQLLIVNEKPLNRRRLNNPPKEANSINNYQLTINNLQLKQANLAYIIYTSGSTGQPKGVMLEHRSLVNLVIYHYRHTNLDFSRVAQFASICFDVSFQEIFFTLLAGGTLYVLDKQTKTDISTFCRVIKKNKIQTLFLPISFIKMIFKEPDYAAQFQGSIRHIVSAGEQVVVLDSFKRYLKENNVYLHNHYGPSETHVVTALTLDPNNEIPEFPSIGKPISNTAIYILDKSLHLQPPGITGELAVGGIAVGRGYLNNPELTAEKFDQDLWDYRDYHDEKFLQGGPGGAVFSKSAPPGR
ncbi:MAG: AMP-binding protein, partial [Candidatus Aminicenantes bacterium]